MTMNQRSGLSARSEPVSQKAVSEGVAVNHVGHTTTLSLAGVQLTQRDVAQLGVRNQRAALLQREVAQLEDLVLHRASNRGCRRNPTLARNPAAASAKRGQPAQTCRAEMWGADSAAAAQPWLWLTTSTLCPSGS